MRTFLFYSSQKTYQAIVVAETIEAARMMLEAQEYGVKWILQKEVHLNEVHVTKLPIW